jgi:hypothetical protein
MTVRANCRKAATAVGEGSKTYLLPASKKELVGINAISDSAADNGEPVEDNRRLIRVLE